MTSSTDCQENLTLDPQKRVCYTQGLVLGVDEFIQEELYFLEQNRVHNRGLHGYGTVTGLDVQIRDTTADGPEIYVAPGLAVDPLGRTIHVPEARCANLNQYLSSRELSSPPVLTSPAGSITLYLTLRYQCCKTDLVPIPSGPCRTEEDARTPSRVADAFAFALSDMRPDQFEADAVRAFGQLLRAIKVSDDEPPTIDLDGLLARVRGFALRPLDAGELSPPMASPLDVLRIEPQNVEAYFRTAFRVWVEEVRPTLVPESQVADAKPAEERLLLAELQVPVTGDVGALVVDGLAADVVLAEDERPFLLHTQLLQELLMGTLDRDQEPPVLEHAALNGLAGDDHTQYLLVADRVGSPAPAEDTLVRDLNSGGNFIRGLPQGSAGGEPLVFNQSAGGDLAGVYPNPVTVNLRGVPLDVAGATAGEVLTFRTGPNRWEAAPLPPPQPGPGQDTNFEEALTRIIALSWPHGGPFVADTLRVPGLPGPGVVIAFGTDREQLAPVIVGEGSADTHSIEVSVETEAKGFVQCLKLPVTIVPVEPVLDGTRVVQANPVPDRVAAGVGVVFPRGGDNGLPDIPGEPRRIVIQVHGEHIQDERRRAIDAEFTRSELPTGDRPQGSEIGLQGGKFLSWIVLPTRRPEFRSVNAEELAATVSGIGRTVAERIVAFRDRPGFQLRSFEELQEVEGVGQALAAEIARNFRLTRQ